MEGAISLSGTDAYPKDDSPNTLVSGTKKASRDNSSCQSQSLVWIKIESSRVQASTSFSIPVSVMLQREVEMQAAARANNIGKERWTSSRIFRMWKSQCTRQQQRQKHQRVDNGLRERNLNNSDASGEIFLRLTPEVSLQNSNSSCRLFRWKPWLTACISSYYNTGNLRIPSECAGDDVLLTLEYFGILTSSPNDFIFDSSHAYIRTQAWSRYFTHRASLAESLLDAYDDAEIQESDQNKRKSASSYRATLCWVLLEEGEDETIAEDGFFVAGKKHCCPEAKSQQSSNHRRQSARNIVVRNAGGLYGLLCGKENPKQGRINEEDYEEGTEASVLTKEMPYRMRQDFCEHLRQSLPPWITVEFNVETVEVLPTRNRNERSSGYLRDSRPVIRIRDDNLLSTTLSKEKDKELSVSSNMESLHGKGDSTMVVLDQPSRGRHVPTFQCIEKMSNLISPDKADNSVNGRNCNTVEKAQRRYPNDGSESTEAIGTAHAKINPLNETGSLIKMEQTEKPITYINMDFGDLRSVTSVLSEPVIDDKIACKEIHTSAKVVVNGADMQQCKDGSTVLLAAKKIVQKRSERVGVRKNVVIDGKRSKYRSASLNRSEISQDEFEQSIKTPPRTTRKLRSTPPWDLSRISNAGEDEGNIKKYETANEVIDANESSRSDLRLNEVKSPEQSMATQLDYDNSDTKSEIAPSDFHGSWGHLLASMCEAMIPAPSSSISSSSPTREFRLSPSKKTRSRSTHSDEYQTRIVKENGGIEPRPVGIVDQAMRMGNDLSNQFDELMRIAYSDNNNDAGHLNGDKSLFPISEEIPGTILSIDATEDLTLASCLTSSVIGQPQSMDPAENFGKVQKMKRKSLYRKVRNTMASSSPNRIKDRGLGAPQSSRDKGRMERGNAASKTEKRLYDSGEVNRMSSTGNKLSSVYHAGARARSRSGDLTSKENRFSQQHENRFYC